MSVACYCIYVHGSTWDSYSQFEAASKREFANSADKHATREANACMLPPEVVNLSSVDASRRTAQSLGSLKLVFQVYHVFNFIRVIVGVAVNQITRQ